MKKNYSLKLIMENFLNEKKDIYSGEKNLYKRAIILSKLFPEIQKEIAKEAGIKDWKKATNRQKNKFEKLINIFLDENEEELNIMGSRLHSRIKSVHQKYRKRVGGKLGYGIKWIEDNYTDDSLDMFGRSIHAERDRAVIEDKYGNRVHKKIRYEKGGDFDGFSIRLKYGPKDAKEHKGRGYINMSLKGNKERLKKEYYVIDKKGKRHDCNDEADWIDKMEEFEIFDETRIAIYSLNEKLSQKDVPGMKELEAEFNKLKDRKRKNVNESLSRGSLYRRRYSRY